VTPAQQSTWKLGIWSILNAQGKPWTPHVFTSQGLAQGYLDAEAKNNPHWHLSKHRVALVSVTVRARKSK
jgi:hypothetical protein